LRIAPDSPAALEYFAGSFACATEESLLIVSGNYLWRIGPACLAALLTARIAPVICIDPGHPSEVNPGFTVQNGTTETHIDWVVAKRLAKLLQSKGFRVVLTKSKEKQLVRNKQRAIIANQAGAALMVRLHCDSSPSSGYTLYYPDRTGTQDGVTGPSVAVRDQSKIAAVAMLSGMDRVLSGRLRSGGVKGDSKTYIGSRQGALTGSIYSNVPVVTVEMVVLSNRADANFIKSEAGQDKMANAISEGIVHFIDKEHEKE
jgi:N-acetylmuramoyl-L-alanine amidase